MPILPIEIEIEEKEKLPYHLQYVPRFTTFSYLTYIYINKTIRIKTVIDITKAETILITSLSTETNYLLSPSFP
jgi:hypothetical protein